MNCPVLTELKLTEAYEPEHENPPVLSGGSYDIEAIRSCGENCKVAAENARLREAIGAFAEGCRWAADTWKRQPFIAPLFAIAGKGK